jgi:hypothetical protein
MYRGTNLVGLAAPEVCIWSDLQHLAVHRMKSGREARASSRKTRSWLCGRRG